MQTGAGESVTFYVLVLFLAYYFTDMFQSIQCKTSDKKQTYALTVGKDYTIKPFRDRYENFVFIRI